MQWYQLDHMQTICISLQTDNHINTSSLNVYRHIYTHTKLYSAKNRENESEALGQVLFLMPNQQCQSTEGNTGKQTTAFVTNTVASLRQHLLYEKRVSLLSVNQSERDLGSS